MTELSDSLLPTDDDGSGTTGTKQNRSYWETWKDAINALIHSPINPSSTPADAINLGLALYTDHEAIKDELTDARDVYASLDLRLDTNDTRVAGSIESTGYLKDPYPKRISHTAGTGIATGPAPLRFGVDVSTTGNAAGATSTLYSSTLPGGSLENNGDALVLRARGAFAANGNAKTLNVVFGGTTVAIFSSTYNNLVWDIEVLIVRLSSTSQALYVRGLVGSLVFGTNVVMPPPASPAETLSGDINFSLTGGGAGANDVTRSFAHAKID